MSDSQELRSNQKQVTLSTEKVVHRGEKRIKLKFPYDSEFLERIKKIKGCKWSQTMNCWHVPDNKASQIVLSYFGINLYNDECSSVKDKKKQDRNKKLPIKGSIPDLRKKREIKQYIEWLKSMRYSEKTILSYTDAILVFFRFCSDKTPTEICNEDIVRFNHDFIIKNGYSVSYQNQSISAIKLFYRTIEKKEIIINEIERPRGSRRIPEILSQSEVENLIKSIVNLKQRAMLSLIYACGLRRSEVLNLRLTSVDSNRRLLIIKGAKGNKDRIAPLPLAMIEMLRKYYKDYKPRFWLFEGSKAGEKYTESSLQQVFRHAVKKAGIAKYITIHTLRHSYATHLLENGIDLRFIQEILGHKSSKTTEIYTHVTSKSIEKIKSPFDNLKL
jgi:integrase/recombinase XerD